MPPNLSEHVVELHVLSAFKKVENMRIEIIDDLKIIRDSVVVEGRQERVGRIAYSSTGIVGGIHAILGIAISPVTFGASLELTVAGASVGGASIAHGIAKYLIVTNKCKTAEQLLKEYNSQIDELAVLIDNLLKASKESCPVIESYLGQFAGVRCDLTNFVGTSFRLSFFSRSLASVVNSVRARGEAATEGASVASSIAGAGARVASTATKAFRITGGILAAFSIVIYISTIIDAGIDLQKNTLIKRAQQLSNRKISK